MTQQRWHLATTILGSAMLILLMAIALLQWPVWLLIPAMLIFLVSFGVVIFSQPGEISQRWRYSMIGLNILVVLGSLVIHLPSWVYVIGVMIICIPQFFAPRQLANGETE